MLGQFDHPDFVAAVDRTAKAAAAHGKYCGILLPAPGDFSRYFDKGYRFLASGSDAVLLNNAARNLVSSISQARAVPSPSQSR
jgi:2-keto-3-deoxy-L-rhamnonate aldolase RhmA